MRSIYENFKENVKSYPNKTALVIDKDRLTYKELFEKVEIYSHNLKHLGVSKKTHIATLLGNSVHIVILMLAVAKLNAVLVPLPSSVKKEGLKNLLKSCDVDFVVTNSILAKEISSLGFKTVIYNDLKKNEMSKEKIKNIDLDINLSIDLDAPYILTTTSGSTGNPKPIILSQKTKIIRAIEGVKEIYNLSNQDIILASTPLYHSLAERLVLLPLMIGATSVVMPKFNLANWFQTVHNEKVTFTILVSSQLENILKEINLFSKDFDLSTLKTVVSSSAPLTEEGRKMALEVSKKFGWDIHECYGTSEIGIATNICITKEKNKWKSVGKPINFVKLKIVDEDGSELPIGKVGEIMCKTKTVFSGYYKLSKITKESFDKDGYFHTGDLGYLDKDGYLYYVGRKKEVIITGGINVYPQDVESVILSHYSVKECVVVGLEDDYFGEVIAAVIVPYSKEKFSLKEIRKLCLEKLAVYQQPLVFKITDKIPKNHLGKVSRKDIKTLFKREDIKPLITKLKASLGGQ